MRFVVVAKELNRNFKFKTEEKKRSGVSVRCTEGRKSGIEIKLQRVNRRISWRKEGGRLFIANSAALSPIS